MPSNFSLNQISSFCNLLVHQQQNITLQNIFSIGSFILISCQDKSCTNPENLKQRLCIIFSRTSDDLLPNSFNKCVYHEEKQKIFGLKSFYGSTILS